MTKRSIPMSGRAARRGITRIVAAMAWVGVLASMSMGDTRLSLRNTARVAGDAPVTLGQIATIEGDDAERLAALVVIESPGDALRNDRGWIEVDLERVRELLGEHGVRVSALDLRGRSCAIMPLGHMKRSIEAKPTIVVQTEKARPALEGHVRKLSASTIARVLSVAVDDLRLTFDSRDSLFLDESADGRVIDVVSAGISDRMPLAITVYRGEEIVESRTIRIGVLVRRRVLIATREIRRGDAIARSDAKPVERWLVPTLKPAHAGDTFGRVATRLIRKDRVIEGHMVEPPVVINRGDLVNVHCISGTILIELQRMRARRDGRVGEIIEFESADGQRRRILARVSGAGRAVIVVGDTGGGV